MNEFLCAPGQSYYVTDLSKGAMTVDSAKQDPVPRYDRWWYLFRREVKLVSHERIRLFAMGSTVARYLNGKLPYEAKLPHWSGQASGHWKRIKESRSDEYARFAPTITLENIVMTARKVMIAAGMHLFVQETLDRIRTLPDSRKWLAFAYKVEIDRWWNATRRQTGD